MIPSFLESMLVREGGLAVSNPATGETIANAPIFSREQASAAIIAAENARQDWAARGLSDEIIEEAMDRLDGVLLQLQAG